MSVCVLAFGTQQVKWICSCFRNLLVKVEFGVRWLRILFYLKTTVIVSATSAENRSDFDNCISSCIDDLKANSLY